MYEYAKWFTKKHTSETKVHSLSAYVKVDQDEKGLGHTFLRTTSYAEIRSEATKRRYDAFVSVSVISYRSRTFPRDMNLRVFVSGREVSVSTVSGSIVSSVC